jgi:succinate dehydrogenase/fumarate reductase cytochrome b subunit
MTMHPPPVDQHRDDAEAFLAARRSLLTLAFLGFGMFTAMAAFFALGAAMQGYEWSCGLPKAASACLLFTMVCLTSLYGMWVFAQLIRCGMLLDGSNRSLPEAMDRHRAFWTHASILSLLCLGLFIVWSAHDLQSSPARSR